VTTDLTPDRAGAAPAPLAGAAHELARRCADAMWAADLASRRLGMRVDDVAPGRATLSMRVTAEMVNGHGTCHGGYLAVLADSAFAFACNTYDEVTVAAGFDIVFTAPAHLGDDLVAVAVERVRRGRSGVYDVTLTRASGVSGASGAGGTSGAGDTGSADVVAEYRGRSRSLGRPLLGPDGSADGVAPGA
jgi:acyl-CoA thioesterase